MINPLSAIGGINALQTAVEAIRSAIGIITDIRSAGGSANKQQEEAIDTAINLANQNAAIAEAQLALSFGYELCKCEFPPTPMRTVGRHIKASAHGKKEGDPVYECPKCGYNTAGRDDYERLASKNDHQLVACHYFRSTSGQSLRSVLECLLRPPSALLSEGPFTLAGECTAGHPSTASQFGPCCLRCDPDSLRDFGYFNRHVRASSCLVSLFTFSAMPMG